MTTGQRISLPIGIRRAGGWVLLLQLTFLTLAATVVHPALQSSAGATPPVHHRLQVTTVDPPAGAPAVDAQWLRRQAADGTSQLFFVVRPPEGKGPFPLIISLHGGSGLLGGSLEHAARVARAGYVVVGGCWLPNRTDAGDPIWCTNPGPPDAAVANIATVARTLRGVRKDRVGVIGYSAGTGPLFLHRWGRWVRALAADSGAPLEQNSRVLAARQVAPVLLLVGTDDPNLPNVQRLEVVLRATGRSVEAHYFEGGVHVVTIRDQPGTIRDDANTALVNFFDEHLRKEPRG